MSAAATVQTQPGGGEASGNTPTSATLVKNNDSMTFHDSPPPTLSARFASNPDFSKGGVSLTGYGHGNEAGDGDGERSLPGGLKDPQAVILRFIQHLTSPEYSDTDPQYMAIGYELEALLAIFSPSSVKLTVSSRPSSFHPDYKTPSTSTYGGTESSPSMWQDAVFDEQIGFMPGERIRYEVTIPTWEEGEVLDGVEQQDMPGRAPKMRVLISLPPAYPNSAPPQLQLLGRYLGNYPIDSGLFGDITRTYITSTGVTFIPGDVCVFEGLTHVQALAKQWYAGHIASASQGEKTRQATKGPVSSTFGFADLGSPASSPMASRNIHSQLADLNLDHTPSPYPPGTSGTGSGSGSSTPARRPTPPRQTFSYDRDDPTRLPDDLVITASDPIIDRKSTFIGHAVRVTNEKEVPLVIHELLSDKKIAKAAHPAIFAYRIVKDVGGVAGKVVLTDHDDDGETAAGGRLSHLLEILEVENVLVVVSRWYGGTLLGADRFKHINQAARDALEKAGLLDAPDSAGTAESGKSRRK